MTTISSPSPDDVCGVCGVKRDEHGDMNHQFNLDGVLIPLKPGPTPTNTPPQPRNPQAGVGGSELTNAFLRLVERLIQQDVLKGEDLIYIFGGGRANSGG